MTLSVQIDDREVQQLLTGLSRVGADGRKLAAHVAARTAQDHFARRGGGFYADAARATTGRVQGDDVIVSIDQVGIALRRFGGTVRPVRGKYLAVPDEDNPQARNNSPRRIDGLHFRQNRGKDSGRLTDRTGRVFYWLVKQTVHKPDPTVLPTDADFARAIIPELEAKLERI